MVKNLFQKYTDLLPETAEGTQRLQKKGIKIGVSTGFIRVMVDVLLEAAIKQGFTPDATVAGDEVLAARSWAAL